MKWVVKQFIGIPGETKKLFLAETFETEEKAKFFVTFMDSVLKARGNNPELYEFIIEEKPD